MQDLNKPENQLYTLQEVMEYTGFSRVTIYRHIAKGALQVIKVQNSVRVRRAALVDYLGFDPDKR